jgi:uncharacterized protein (DUF433 family)
MAVPRAEIEAERMRRVPGIFFADGPVGRRARVTGTGIDVFEIIKSYKAMGRDWRRLRSGYDWLSEEQLQAALDYYALYPDEIEARLEREATIEREAMAARKVARSR